MFSVLIILSGSYNHRFKETYTLTFYFNSSEFGGKNLLLLLDPSGFLIFTSSHLGEKHIFLFIFFFIELLELKKLCIFMLLSNPTDIR